MKHNHMKLFLSPENFFFLQADGGATAWVAPPLDPPLGKLEVILGIHEHFISKFVVEHDCSGTWRILVECRVKVFWCHALQL